MALLAGHGGLFILVVNQLPPRLLLLVGASLCGANRLRPNKTQITAPGACGAIRRAEPSSHQWAQALAIQPFAGRSPAPTGARRPGLARQAAQAVEELADGGVEELAAGLLTQVLLVQQVGVAHRIAGGDLQALLVEQLGAVAGALDREGGDEDHLLVPGARVEHAQAASADLRLAQVEHPLGVVRDPGAGGLQALPHEPGEVVVGAGQGQLAEYRCREICISVSAKRVLTSIPATKTGVSFSSEFSLIKLSCISKASLIPPKVS